MADQQTIEDRVRNRASALSARQLSLVDRVKARAESVLSPGAEFFDAMIQSDIRDGVNSALERRKPKPRPADTSRFDPGTESRDYGNALADSLSLNEPLGTRTRLGQALRGMLEAVDASTFDTDRTTLGEFFASMGRETIELPAAAAGALSAMGRQADAVFGATALTSLLHDWNEAVALVSQAASRQLLGNPDPKHRVAGAIGGSIPQLGLAVTAGAATAGFGTPAVLAAFAGTSAAPVVGQTYNAALRDTGDVQAASQEAMLNGGVTTLTSVLPGFAIFQRLPGGKEITRRAVSKTIGRLGLSAAAEGSQEYVEGVTSDIFAQAMRAGADQEDLKTILFKPERFIEALAGAVGGGAARGAVELGGLDAGAGETQDAETGEAGLDGAVPPADGTAPSAGPEGVGDAVQVGKAKEEVPGLPAQPVEDAGQVPVQAGDTEVRASSEEAVAAQPQEVPSASREGQEISLQPEGSQTGEGGGQAPEAQVAPRDGIEPPPASETPPGGIQEDVPRGTPVRKGEAPIVAAVGEEITGVARRVAGTTTRAVHATGRLAQRIFRREVEYLKTLGPVGEQIAGDIEGIDQRSHARLGQDTVDLRRVLQGLTRKGRENVARLVNNPGQEASIPAGIRTEMVAKADEMRAILDRVQTEFSRVTGRQWVPTGEGAAFPHVLNARGHEEMERIRLNRPSATALGKAERMVEEGRFKSVDAALAAWRAFAEQRHRGVVAYLEGKRTGVPDEWLEYDPVKVLPNVLRRAWLTTEASRQWGHRESELGLPFPALIEREAALEQGSPFDARRLHDFLQAEFGIRDVSPETEKLTSAIRSGQFATKIAPSPVSILRNGLDRIAKGMGLAPLSVNVRAALRYPPIVNRWIASARRVQDEAESAGLIFAHTAIAEGAEPGTVLAENIGRPFTATERGNQTYIATVARLRMERDLARYLRLKEGTDGPVSGVFRAVASLGEDTPKNIERRLRKDGLLKLTPDQILDTLSRAGDPKVPDALQAALWRTVRDSAFPVTLSTKRGWWQGNTLSPWLRVSAQFKVWGVEQMSWMYRTVLRELRHGNAAPAVRFVAATTLVGEIYNVVRDYLTGREQSALAQRDEGLDDVMLALAKDFVDGGGIGMVADLTWGLTDWALGPTAGTVEEAGKAIVDVVQQPRLAPQAIGNFLKSQTPVSRQVEGAIERIDSAIDDEQSRWLAYNNWRQRAFEFRDLKERERLGQGARVQQFVSDVVQGRDAFDRGPNTLALELAARSITDQDIDEAADYIRVVLSTADNPRERGKRLDGIRSSMRSRSPLGPIPGESMREFFDGLSDQQVGEAHKLDRDWLRDYEQAIRKAVYGTRN